MSGISRFVDGSMSVLVSESIVLDALVELVADLEAYVCERACNEIPRRIDSLVPWICRMSDCLHIYRM